jgi:hypothetical protein
LGAGLLPFAPWLPVFLSQLGHTGTPWAKPAGPTALLSTVAQYSGGSSTAGRALGLLAVGLAGLGACGKAVDGRRVEVDLLGRPPGRVLALVFGGSLAFAVAAGVVARTGIEARYTAVVFPLLVLLAALGTTTLTPRRTADAVVAAAALIGLVVAASVAPDLRTQAGEVASQVERRARPGDVVAYCPDQLGPAVSRLLPTGLTQLTFPGGGSPGIVDWADYGERQARGDVDAFAAALDRRTGPQHTLWLVWAGGYRTLGDRCERLHARLAEHRPSAHEVLMPLGETRSVEASHLTSYWPR